MGEGIFPSKKAVSEFATEEDMESERRLAYVALTRGRDSVTIISSAGNPKSRFVEEACIRPFSSEINESTSVKTSSLSYTADLALADMILDDHGDLY